MSLDVSLLPLPSPNDSRTSSLPAGSNPRSRTSSMRTRTSVFHELHTVETDAIPENSAYSASPINGTHPRSRSDASVTPTILPSASPSPTRGSRTSQDKRKPSFAPNVTAKGRSASRVSAQMIRRHTGTRWMPLVEEGLPPTLVIPPWKDVREDLIKKSLEVHKDEEDVPFVTASALSTTVGRQFTSANTQTFASFNSALTIPHGFQLVRTLRHYRPDLIFASYVPHFAQWDFVSLDKTALQFFRATERVWKLPLGTETMQTHVQKDNMMSNRVISELAYPYECFRRVTSWVYVERYKLYVATVHQQPELRIFNSRMDTVGKVNCGSPILHLISVGQDEIIASGVGAIKIFQVLPEEVAADLADIFTLKLLRTCYLPDVGNWANTAIYIENPSLIIVGAERSIYMVDYKSALIVDVWPNVLDARVTALEWYVAVGGGGSLAGGLLVVGGKNGKIKVYNSQHCLMQEFVDHSRAVTGLVLMNRIVGLKKPSTAHSKSNEQNVYVESLPLLISSSLDGTLRVWNLETLQGQYRRVLSEARCFSWTQPVRRSPVVFLQRLPATPWHYARIAVGCMDGSMRFLSPATAATICVAFPTGRTTGLPPRGLVIDATRSESMAYILAGNGDVVSYDLSNNPCTVQNTWEWIEVDDEKKALRRHRLLCLLGVVWRLFGESSDRFQLVAGTEIGQIILFESGEQTPLAQAHTSPVTSLHFDRDSQSLVSTGDGTRDKAIKVWLVKTDTAESTKTPKGKRERMSFDGRNAEKGPPFRLVLQSVVSCNSQILQPLCLVATSVQGSTSPSLTAVMPWSGIRVINLKQHAEILEKGNDDAARSVTSIVHLRTLSIYASSHVDGFVKIWDAEGTIVKEIQFPEAVLSIAFANERGDLLVGLSDSISLIMIQDYMPARYLQTAVQKFDENVDDLLEDPIAFEEKTDLWGLVFAKKAARKWERRKTIRGDNKREQSSSPNELSSKSGKRVVGLGKIGNERPRIHFEDSEISSPVLQSPNSTMKSTDRQVSLSSLLEEPENNQNDMTCGVLEEASWELEKDSNVPRNAPKPNKATSLRIQEHVNVLRRMGAPVPNSVFMDRAPAPVIPPPPKNQSITVANTAKLFVRRRPPPSKPQITPTLEAKEPPAVYARRQSAPKPLPLVLSAEDVVEQLVVEPVEEVNVPVSPLPPPIVTPKLSPRPSHEKLPSMLFSKEREPPPSPTSQNRFENEEKSVDEEETSEAGGGRARVLVRGQVTTNTNQAVNYVFHLLDALVGGTTLPSPDATTADTQGRATIFGTLPKEIPATLFSLLEWLFKVVREDEDFSHKRFAMAAIVQVFKGFSHDLHKVSFLDPLLDCVYDCPDAEVRAQACACLVAMCDRSTRDAVIVSLISRLGDMDEFVRQVAIEALTYVGIESKMALREEMLRLGLLSFSPSSDVIEGLKSLNVRISFFASPSDFRSPPGAGGIGGTQPSAFLASIL
ncbi:WD repeat-containing protein 87 [Gonapodya sp. JEL0774]|nr:WD repeat-containing protein 87 [Gonapodya sp. JEL0774]